MADAAPMVPGSCEEASTRADVNAVEDATRNVLPECADGGGLENISALANAADDIRASKEVVENLRAANAACAVDTSGHEAARAVTRVDEQESDEQTASSATEQDHQSMHVLETQDSDGGESAVPSEELIVEEIRGPQEADLGETTFAEKAAGTDLDEPTIEKDSTSPTIASPTVHVPQTSEDGSAAIETDNEGVARQNDPASGTEEVELTKDQANTAPESPPLEDVDANSDGDVQDSSALNRPSTPEQGSDMDGAGPASADAQSAKMTMDNEEPYPRNEDNDLGAANGSPISGEEIVYDDPYSTDVDEDVLAELPEGGFLKGILKLPSNSADDTDSASPESPNRVRFTLPEGHVDVPERAPIDKYNSRPSRPGTMDAPAMSLDDIINRYSKACELLEVEPMRLVLRPLQNMAARGEDGLPSILDLRGEKRLDHRHVRIICDYMCHNNKLRDLNMAGIALKDADLELIQQAVFQRRQSMSRLNFSGNPRIGRAGFGSIGTMISKSVFLSYLNVSGCPFTARTAETFKDAIAACKLKTLIMHSCNLKVAKCLKPIVAGLLVCSHISEVSMKSNDIPASSAQILVGLFQQECVVETLDLRSNKLGNAGVSTLATALSRNRRILKLVLFDNGISRDGAIALFMALRSNNTLNSLDLSQNEIGLPETLEHLKRLLICNAAIENLFLWNVGIQDHGAIILGEGIAENESLKRVELRNNVFSAIGLMALCHGIKVNGTVYKVLLDVPDETEKSKQELALSAYQGIQHHCGQNLVRSGVQEPRSIMSRFAKCGQR